MEIQQALDSNLMLEAEPEEPEWDAPQQEAPAEAPAGTARRWATAAAPPSARHVLVMQTAVAIASVRGSLAGDALARGRMTAHTSSAPRTALASVASNAAPQTPDRRFLGEQRMEEGGRERAAEPEQRDVEGDLHRRLPAVDHEDDDRAEQDAGSIAHGWAKMSQTSGSSLSEKMWTLRRSRRAPRRARRPRTPPRAATTTGAGAARGRAGGDMDEGERQRAAPSRQGRSAGAPGAGRPAPCGACVVLRSEPGSARQPSPERSGPHEEPPQELPPQEEPPRGAAPGRAAP